MRGHFSIGLSNPKIPENIGGVLRACGCYGASMLAITGKRYEKHGCDTMKQWKHMPFLQVDDLHEVIPYGSAPIAIELVPEARSLVGFIHPEQAFYIFGPEDGTLGSKILDWCPYKIMVPTRRCMNLASCVNVVLYDRLQKQLRK